MLELPHRGGAYQGARNERPVDHERQRAVYGIDFMFLKERSVGECGLLSSLVAVAEEASEQSQPRAGWPEAARILAGQRYPSQAANKRAIPLVRSAISASPFSKSSLSRL